MIKLYLAILNRGWIRREILYKIANKEWREEGVEIVLENPNKTWDHPISSNRNRIVKRFLQTDCDYLMMIDDDVVPLFNPIPFVFADKDIIGFPAKVRQQTGYLNWVAYVKDPDRDSYAPVDFSLIDDTIELLKLDIVGTGCILIKRKVLESLKAPFHTDFDEDGILTTGTDFAFCIKAGTAGFEIYTAPQRICEHYKEAGLLQFNTYSDSDNTDPAAVKYGIPWGGFAINPVEWNFIKRIILENDVKTVCEFGAGLSSLLMSEKCKVKSYEVDKKWAEKIQAKRNGSLDVRLWDGETFADYNKNEKYDLVFIDGPRGGENREHAYDVASMLSDRIICHDARRLPDTAWQKKYLQGQFKLKARSGYYQACCHYWERKK
ncbi:MAG TPA: hypothetical protein VMW53_11165 [archaeon]|nr:hypothetical protein [archaeon]